MQPEVNARSDDHRNGDVRMGERGQFFVAEWDNYARCLEWVPLLPIGASQSSPPDGSVLVCRVIEGRATAVTELGDGELYAVRTVA